jgi:tetratricopeptide (TPR) repeat protein
MLFNIAQAKRKMEVFDESLMYYLRALSILIPSHGGSFRNLEIMTSQAVSVSCPVKTVHRIIVPILHCLGLVYYRQGNLSEAAIYYEKALLHGSAILGSSDLCVGFSLNCLGVIYYHSSDVPGSDESPADVSLRFFSDALQILGTTLGPHSPAVATCLNNLGRVMVQRDDFVSALQYYEKALEIRKDSLGVDNLDYAATAFNSGQSLHQLGDYDRAILLYKEFLRVASLRCDRNHRDGTWGMMDMCFCKALTYLHA